MTMVLEEKSLAVCICTYKREKLLENLINEIMKQTVKPEYLIIIDGNPASNKVVKLLKNLKLGFLKSLYYVGSNHSNLSYQRYLGWRVANDLNIKFLLFLDDDLQINQKNAFQVLLATLEDQSIVGVTSIIKMGEWDPTFNAFSQLLDRSKINQHSFLRKLGSSNKIKAGGLSPTGDRILPLFENNKSLYELQWLRGGVMLFRIPALDQSCFSNDLFALDEINCGKGEDTYLSRQVMRKGKLMINSKVIIDHPNLDSPKTYPIDAFHFAYATAFSRRFLNDHYRISEPPRFSDRMALFKSYLGNNLINLFQFIMHPAKHRFAYFWGYFLGSIRGLFQKPTARNLAPNIDWLGDAESALSQLVRIR